ncbi:MAG: UDP-N-acetylmuramate dehydrogenase [Lachnoclostridium edouardi]|uniref:UDP-N-acetylmuramate dehydrogenase n=1 Tax=Lachnoclostridium edouardi TaxID=1926283 RepID=UPI0026DB20E9|nr:UDP-N-acetylmuramate dehydrogenase [Lachnoclostridium edouardi]MDO4279416.1 UDP-N-acetylmuramate dehydrogenase [Lachnoclostridium edouardi]
MDRFLEKLRQTAGENKVKTNEAMAKYTTFRVGGPADYFVTPAGPKELAEILKLCRDSNMPFFILGNGSNLLVSDKGFRGVVIEIGKPFDYCEVKGARLTAGAGCLLSAIAKKALDHSLTGLECAAGIPGSLGGAVVMNAGAYGFEMKDIIAEVTVLKPDGQIAVLPLTSMEFGYRTSIVAKQGYIVLEAVLQLEQGDREEIKKKMEDLAARRREKQPLEYPSGGSTFKRPEGYFAGKLIEDAGFRGYCVGGAQVSEKHCGFVINKDHATAEDICRLCGEIQEKIMKDTGVALEMEIKRIGEFEGFGGKK